MTDVVLPCVLPKGNDGMPRPTYSDRMYIQGKWLHATPNIVRPFVLPYGADGMPRPLSCDNMHLPKAMMACHALRVPIVFVFQGRWQHATPDAIWSCILSNGEDGMPRSMSSERVCFPREMNSCHVGRHPTLSMLSNCDDVMPHPTSSDHVFIPMAMMACHARHIPTLWAAQGRWWHATPAIVRPCVMSKGDDVMPRSM